MHLSAKSRLVISLTSAGRVSFAQRLFSAAILGAALLGGSVASAQQQPTPAPATAPADDHPEFPAGAGRDITLRLCSRCHSPNNILAMGRTQQGWQDLIIKMTTLGLQGSDEEFTAVLDYLTANFPPMVNVNKASAAQMASALTLTTAEGTAIVSYRAKNGNFKTIDDLKKVPGVDAKKIDDKKALLQF
jgi:competence protein ComEA